MSDRHERRAATPVSRYSARALVRVAPVMALPRLLREHGVEPARFLERFALRPTDFGRPDDTLGFANLAGALEAAAQATDCPHLGLLVGQRARLNALGTLGFLMQSAPDVETALQIGTDHLPAHNQGASVAIADEGNFVAVAYSVVDPSVGDHWQLLDVALAGIFNVLRDLCGPQWQPAVVRLARGRPEDLLPYRHLFQAPLEFSAGETSVVFARSWLRHSLPTADPFLHSLMQDQLNEIERAEAGNVADRIRRLLPTMLAARNSSIAVVAERLGSPVRTLSRVLVREGTTYRLLRDEARYTMACELLRSQLSVAEVSDRLGYTNPTAFTFAFRRWARVPPSKWREQANTRAERRTPGSAGRRRQRDK